MDFITKYYLNATITASADFNLGLEKALIKDFFFKVDMTTREEIFNLYGEKYGEKAEAKMSKKFNKWKNGTVLITNAESVRLLKVLIPFIKVNSNKILLLKNQKYNFSETPKKKIKAELAIIHAEKAIIKNDAMKLQQLLKRRTDQYKKLNIRSIIVSEALEAL